MSEPERLNCVCNAWHVDSLERLQKRVEEVLPLVKRNGAVYVCSPKMAVSISRSAKTLHEAIAALLTAAEEKTREAGSDRRHFPSE